MVTCHYYYYYYYYHHHHHHHHNYYYWMVWGSYRGAYEESSLSECYTLSIGKSISTFQKIVLPPKRP